VQIFHCIVLYCINEGIILHVSAVSLNTLFIWHTKDHDIMLKQCMII